MKKKYGFLLLFIDIFFLYIFMIKNYKKMILDIQGYPMKSNPWYVLLSYLLMTYGLYEFVLPRITSRGDWIHGIKFGIIVYGVYDFVCASIFDKWDTKLMIIDIMWGGTVYGIISLYL